MRFKAKLRRIGNSQGIYIPLKVITGYNIGEEIEMDVITRGEETKREAPKVITPKETEKDRIVEGNKMEWCKKHNSWKATCGCK